MDLENKIIIDQETGEEVISLKDYELDKAKENTRKLENQKVGIERKKSSDETQQFIDYEFGNFYFNFYKELLDKGIERQYLFRYIYLCTYMDYSNQLVYGNSKGENRIMVEKDLREVLKLSERECRNTKKALIENNLLIINDNKQLSINDKYSIKGSVSSKKKLRAGVRIMEIGIQELYKNSKATEHKKLALLIELLPYINYKHNVVCFNPEESDIRRVLPYTPKELCKILGYSETNQSRLKKDLLSIKINGEDCVGIFIRNARQCIYVNPRIYYKGRSIDELQALSNMFRISK